MKFTHFFRIARELSGVARVCGYRTLLRYAGAIVQSIPSILRTGTLAAADDRMRRYSDSLHVQMCGVQLTYPSQVFSGVREMYARNVYLRLRGFSIRPGDVVVDLGCNEGLFSVLAAKLGARAVAVDVQGGFAVPLQEHLARNGCTGAVSFVHALVGSEAGLCSEYKGGSHYTSDPPQKTLDEILTNIDRVRLMKVDIEGSEFAVFSGDQANWIRKVELIAMEAHPKYGDCSALAKWLAERNFSVTIHKEGYIYAAIRGRA